MSHMEIRKLRFDEKALLEHVRAMRGEYPSLEDEMFKKIETPWGWVIEISVIWEGSIFYIINHNFESIEEAVLFLMAEAFDGDKTFAANSGMQFSKFAYAALQACKRT